MYLLQFSIFHWSWHSFTADKSAVDWITKQIYSNAEGINYFFLVCCWISFFFSWHCSPTRAMASSFMMFLYHTQQCTTVGKTHLDKWSAPCRHLYLTTHNIHTRQTSVHPVGFKPTISARKRPQTYALDRMANGTGYTDVLVFRRSMQTMEISSKNSCRPQCCMWTSSTLKKLCCLQLVQTI
jgi:hypothetical protein